MYIISGILIRQLFRLCSVSILGETTSRWSLSLAINKKGEWDMSRNTILYSVRIVVVAGIFSLGYLCGSLTQQSANAQMGNLGSELLKQAGESSGPLGSLVQLGTTINDMEKNVSSLQKNIDTLKKVKAALGR
jgi:hypothetical protein